MKRWIPQLMFLLLLMLSVGLSAFFLIHGLQSLDSSTAPRSYTLVIDPGHGGIDGGAISANGTKESDINLAIGLKLRSLAEFLGVRTAMTRENDALHTDYEHYSEHDDLVRRTEQINRYPDGVLISIHQNYYPTSQPSGAEILYASSEKSRELGEITQRNLVSLLQPNNRRVAGPASKSLYITSNISCPGILAECGFLSNLADLEQLTREDYQTSLAAVLLLSYLQFVSSDLYT